MSQFSVDYGLFLLEVMLIPWKDNVVLSSVQMNIRQRDRKNYLWKLLRKEKKVVMGYLAFLFLLRVT